MTKVRQSEQNHLMKHALTTPSPIFKFLPRQRGDDSPDSCITQTTTLNQSSTSSSSSCTSVEQHLYQNEKTPYYQEPGCCTSDDDGSHDSVTTQQETIKVGKQSPSLRLQPKKMQFGPQQARLKVPTNSARHVTERSDFTLDTDSTGDEEASNFGSTMEQLLFGPREEENERPADLVTANASRGMQDKRMIVKSGFTSIADFLSSQNDTSESVQDAKTARYSKSPKALVAATEKSTSVSKATQQTELQKLDVLSNLQMSSKGFRVKTEEYGPNKRYGSQGAASQGVVRTFPSPGTPSRSSFSGIPCSAGNQVNQKAYIMGRIAANEFGKGLPLYMPGEDIRSGISKALPSKWDDAEKWLINASPSHPQCRNSPGGATLGSSKQQNSVLDGKKSTNKRQSVAAPGGRKPTNAENEVGGGLPLSSYNSRLQATVSDSELSSTQDQCWVLGRSTSQKLKQCSQTVNGHKLLHQSVGIDTQEVSTNDNHGRFNGCKGSNQLPGGHVAVEQEAPDSSVFWKFPNESMEQGRQSGTQAEVFTQDIYTDTVVETLKHRSPCDLPSERLVVLQTPKHKWSAPMKDAATEISPKVSRRDMGTQITPLGSSRTSLCTTPMKNNSPIRHNTPARRSASWNNTGSNLLELESCHLAKLEYRELPNQNQFHATDHRSVSTWRTREEEEEESSKCLRPSLDMVDVKRNFIEATAAAWEEAERAKYMAKYTREEARVQAWENHQKAKAEAELKKLEVKLEKMRSHASEKIMNKLVAAHRRAEEMRAAAQAQQAEQMAKAAERALNIRKSGHFPDQAFGVCFARLS